LRHVKFREFFDTRGWAGGPSVSPVSIYYLRHEKFCGKRTPPKGGASKAEAAAAIPFPLKPLFLAAAAGADLLISTDF